MKSRGYLVMAPSVLRPLSAARVRPQAYDRRYLVALPETLLDPLLRFTTRTDLSVTACVEWTSARRGKRARNLTLQHNARSPCRSIGERNRGPRSSISNSVPS